MSSFIRRIERTVMPSRPHFEKGSDELIVNPPRNKHYMGRGSKLGVSNPKAKDLLARIARETRLARAIFGERLGQ